MLAVDSLTKRFQGLVAVNQASLTVPAGSITGLIGPNGAGKTTAFNLITGVYQPTEGAVSFAGRNLRGLRPAPLPSCALWYSLARVILPFLSCSKRWYFSITSS